VYYTCWNPNAEQQLEPFRYINDKGGCVPSDQGTSRVTTAAPTAKLLSPWAHTFDLSKPTEASASDADHCHCVSARGAPTAARMHHAWCSLVLLQLFALQVKPLCMDGHCAQHWSCDISNADNPVYSIFMHEEHCRQHRAPLHVPLTRGCQEGHPAPCEQLCLTSPVQADFLEDCLMISLLTQPASFWSEKSCISLIHTPSCGQSYATRVDSSLALNVEQAHFGSTWG
jgi:hypothetical protein